jgi:excisionase family DNA binding protein
VQDKQFLSPNDIASELSVSTSTVLRLIHEQRLPAIRVSDRIYRIPVAAFEKYKAGVLESPSPARISSEISKRPRIGAGESLPEAAEAASRVRSA